ncbi:MAG TPA: glycosyltransferase [Selenomonadales bacterium]|nr:glycosyltransferase [Selenomonadales bacterium]
MNQLTKPFDDAHIFRMTDDTGMFQHARFSVPDLLEGYTTDDNVRALIMAVMLYEKLQKPGYLALVYRYLGFVLYAQNETGRFRNFMTYDRQFTEKEGSEDCFGRCLWALGYTQASPAMPAGIKEACSGAVKRALPAIQSLTASRGQAYALIGLSFSDSPAVDFLICELADSLYDHFEHCAGENWQWFEDSLTYDNAVLPWALFAAYSRLGQGRLLRVARESLSFLDLVTFRDGYFRPVGCNGWLKRGAEPAQYDEQPLEACTATLAHLAAYEATGESAMVELARKSFGWYGGDNSCREDLIDSETGGCRDGITPDGLNRNQGAESIVSYSLARLALAKYETVAGRERLARCSR